MNKSSLISMLLSLSSRYLAEGRNSPILVMEEKAAASAQFDAESFSLCACLTSNDIHTGHAKWVPATAE